MPSSVTATGASIKDLVNESVIIAMKRGSEVVEWTDVLTAKREKQLAKGGIVPTVDALTKILSINDFNRARILKAAATNKAFMPIVVAENLSWEDFARLNLDLPYLQGVQPDVGETRDYPYKEELSHVLGYVAAVSPEDKPAPGEASDPLLDVPGVRIGKRGIEKTYDRVIRGEAGASRVEVNAYGRVIRELEREPGSPGDDVYLTIDRELQQLIHEKLKNDSAAAAVMDVETGDVLALVSTPGYDPNAFNVGVTPEQWSALTTSDHKPLLNKALSGAYPPGSTFKTVTALAALEEGAIGPDTYFTCNGHYTLGSHDFHCWKRGGHGRINLQQAIKVSCDCYFYQVAMKLGKDDRGRLDQYLTSVREIEIRTQRASKWLDTPRPKVAPADQAKLNRAVPLEQLGDYLRTMYDILVLAFQADLTRVATFSTGNEGTGPAVPEIGVRQDRHSLSHHNGNPKLMQELTASDTFNIKQFSYFLDRLAEGTLTGSLAIGSAAEGSWTLGEFSAPGALLYPLPESYQVVATDAAGSGAAQLHLVYRDPAGRLRLVRISLTATDPAAAAISPDLVLAPAAAPAASTTAFARSVSVPAVVRTVSDSHVSSRSARSTTSAP